MGRSKPNKSSSNVEQAIPKANSKKRKRQRYHPYPTAISSQGEGSTTAGKEGSRVTLSTLRLLTQPVPQVPAQPKSRVKNKSTQTKPRKGNMGVTRAVQTEIHQSHVKVLSRAGDAVPQSRQAVRERPKLVTRNPNLVEQATTNFLRGFTCKNLTQNADGDRAAKENATRTWPQQSQSSMMRDISQKNGPNTMPTWWDFPLSGNISPFEFTRAEWWKDILGPDGTGPLTSNPFWLYQTYPTLSTSLASSSHDIGPGVWPPWNFPLVNPSKLSNSPIPNVVNGTQLRRTSKNSNREERQAKSGDRSNISTNLPKANPQSTSSSLLLTS